MWGASPLCLFWTICKERNRISFKNEGLFVQRLKSLFLYNLFCWTKLYIVEGLISFYDFIDWLGHRRILDLQLSEGAIFCFPFLFWPSFGGFCIRPMYFGALCLMLFTQFFFTYQKRK